MIRGVVPVLVLVASSAGEVVAAGDAIKDDSAALRGSAQCPTDAGAREERS